MMWPMMKMKKVMIDMKTKRVELYADLYPDWHENIKPYVVAYTTPESTKASGVLLVRIMVDLPENPTVIEVDAIVTGTATINPN